MKKLYKKENSFAILMYIIIIIVIISVIFILLFSNKQLVSNEKQNILNKDNTEEKQEHIEKISTLDNNDNTEDKNSTAKIEKNMTKKMVETQIATYTTTLYDKEQTRIENINLAISKLNEIIIEKDSEFSFNNTIGPMDEKSGFKKATGFDTNGKKIKMSGGGICQISSTLYNCALIAGFDVTERHPHSRRVYYVPKDKDATIYYGSLDLKFINNSGSNVKIYATATENSVTITLVKIT